MDLIDRNELLKNIDEGVKEEFPCFYNSICAWINKQKVIDAEPVRHGYWKPTINYNLCKLNIYIYTCSKCGYSYSLAFPKERKYCNKCGAKMDAEVDPHAAE